MALRVRVGFHLLRRAFVASRAAEGGVEGRRGVGEADHAHRQCDAPHANQAIVASCATADRHRAAVVIAGSGHAALPCPTMAGAWSCSSPRMCGGSSHVWNGGGEGSCHSSVVAPGPQGLAPATRLTLNAS